MASRQYGLILGLIDGLPRSSKTKAWMEDDEEYVAMVREAYLQSEDEKKKDGKEDDKEPLPSMKEWSESREQTAELVDEIRMLRATVAATAGSKESPKPYARPRTLMMEMSSTARITKRRHKHEALVNKLVPPKE